MPTVFQFLQNPELFPYQSTLTDNPDILHALIDYLTRNPDPLLHNDQECYVYPTRAADILSVGTVYQCVVAKRERKSRKTNQMQNYYPYLDRLFKNLEGQPNLEESLLGYTNRMLISLSKKTPEIYEYIKDNQEHIGLIVKNNKFLQNLREFWVTFLVQSTMSLYIFLKNIVIRNLMFRIIDEADEQNLVAYETLHIIYSEISKRLRSQILPQDEREELDEICENFHDSDFVTLMVLKISSKKPEKTVLIGKLLNQILGQPQSKVGQFFTESHLEAMEQYFQSYEDSSNFMDYLLGDQLEIMKLMLNLCQKGHLPFEYEANFVKRLLVYTSIHKKNSVLQYTLIRAIRLITEAGRTKVFGEINVIPFLMKNSEVTGCRFSYGSMIWKVCQFWNKNRDQLYQFIQEDEIQFINKTLESKTSRIKGLTMYKQPLENKSVVSELPQNSQKDETPENIQSEQKQENLGSSLQKQSPPQI